MTTGREFKIYKLQQKIPVWTNYGPLPELVDTLCVESPQDLGLVSTELEPGVVAEPEAAPLLIAPVLEVVAAEGAAGLQVQPQDLREGPLVKVDLPQTQAQPSLNIINM